MSGLLDRVRRAGDGGERVSVADIVEGIGDNAFPPLILVPALLLISPASAIPGLSSATGLIIALVAVQMVLARHTLWLPRFLRERTIERKRLGRALDFLAGPARFVDRFTRPRLRALTAWPLRLVPSIICLVAGLVIPFFELVPMSSTIIASGIALMALALVTRDGVLLLLGLAALGGVGALVWSVAT